MTPLCEYFGKCGGCSIQHLEYAVQLQNKRKIVEAAAGKEVTVFSGEPYYYRNRLDVIFSGGKIGLRSKTNPGRIVDIDKCVISEPKVNELLAEVRNRLVAVEGIASVILRSSSKDSSIHFVMKEKKSTALEVITAFSKISSAKNVSMSYDQEIVVIKGACDMKVEYLGYNFKHKVNSFFQNNHEMAIKMHEYCKSLLAKHDTKNAVLLDLYAGVGTFGIINAELFREIIIVESVTPAIEAANNNIKENGIKNANAFALDAIKIGRLKVGKPLFVITDPPRSGMDEKTIIALKHMEPEVIIYVSCNQEQLRKDINKFKKYKVTSAAMFDFFPQTKHVESVVELVKR